MDNINRALNYFLFCEYLNPHNLDKIENILKKDDIIAFETSFDKLISQIELNKTKFEQIKEKNKKLINHEIIISIFGGLFRVEKIANCIEKILEKSATGYSESQVADNIAASYCVSLSANLDCEDILDISKFHEISNDDIFISNTPIIMKKLLKSKSIPLNSSQQIFLLQNEIKTQITNIEQKGLLSEYLLKIHNYIMNEIDSNLINEKITDYFENEKQIRVVIKIRKKSNTQTQDFINSLLASDLEKVLNSNDYGVLLNDFLKTDYNGEKIDIRKTPTTSSLSLDNFVLGAFANKYSLMYSQQFAVNEILKRFSKNYGFYSVNGPPGTGKTTLLKDIIAGIIVKRAEILATLEADEILIPSVIKDEYKQPIFYNLNEKLQGFEIIVASSNNGAVENISKEIPEISSICEKYQNIAEEIDYFKDTAQAILNIDVKDEKLKKQAWALMCATLGKSENIHKFNSKFLDKEIGIIKFLNDDDIKSNPDYQRINEKYQKIKKQCKNAWEEYNSGGRLDDDLKMEAIKLSQKQKTLEEKLYLIQSQNFKNAKQEFLNSKNNYEKLRKDTNDLINLYDSLSNKYKTAQNKILEYEKIDFLGEEAKINNAILPLNNKIAILDDQIKEYENKKTNIKLKQPNKPFLFFAHELFNTKIYKQYKQKHEMFLSEIFDNESIMSKFRLEKMEKINQKNELEKQISQLKYKENELQSLKNEIENLKIKHKECETKIINKFGVIFKENKEDKEKSSPFMKDDNGNKTELFEARVDLFFKALALHKAAILANKKEFRKNFYNFGNLKNLDNSIYDRNAKVNIFRTFFFAVPVASSTFAAFGRCFKDFEKEEIGYLLVDEAGQAAISNAIGALWRSRHALIVGDPLQLEPVATLPEHLNKILLEAFNVKDELNLSNTSVQIRADLIETFGTYINDKTWVGSPLLVHNRCNNPMFEIANDIAYDNLMFWGLSKNKTLFENTSDNENLKSQWIDIKTTQWNGNCSIQECERTKELIDEIINFGIKKDEIKIITPFRDVVTNATKFGFNAGTIHTMQGKEAKIIIFVLGGATSGARTWAASKPNLLNVALTRAKNYIYIIGDKENWQDLPNFNKAVDKL